MKAQKKIKSQTKLAVIDIRALAAIRGGLEHDIIRTPPAPGPPVFS